MKICFRQKKLAKQVNDLKKLEKAFGSSCAKEIRRRLDDMKAIACLEEARTLPGRYHELTGNLKGLIACDLKHPYRLIFKPDHEPVPEKDDGGLDWNLVTKIEIVEIMDYH